MLNKQLKLDGDRIVGRGIEWTGVPLWRGVDYTFQGYTANPFGGCKHACKWVMPDGKIAPCYAKTVAEGTAQSAYPQGFEHHYWRPAVLEAIRRRTTPSCFFIDSMADAFGVWVPREQQMQLLHTVRDCPRHVFQILTKNAPGIITVSGEADLPANLWVGVSSAPDFMFGHRLTRNQQEKYLRKALQVLTFLGGSLYTLPVRWMSFEPLSHDVSKIVADYPHALSWAVIGAATNGNAVYQPEPDHVLALLEVLDKHKVPVFYKGNLRNNPAAPNHLWREFFPGYVPSAWNTHPGPEVSAPTPMLPAQQLSLF